MKIACLLAIAFALSASVRAADLEVVVEGVDRVEGNVRIGVYDSEETFRIEPMEQSETVEVVEAGTITAVLKDLEPGIYAVAVVWDLNKNGEVDVSGPFKKPTEPTAFSNMPKMFFGPPKFEDCTFILGEEGGSLEISLIK